jgi:hypothetical protein
LDWNTTWSKVLSYNSASGIEDSLVNWSVTDITAVPVPVNVALRIFGAICLVVIVARSRPVRNRIQRCWVGVNQWIDAV